MLSNTGFPRVYFIETPSDEKEGLICRWVEYFYEKGRRIHIVTETSLRAEHLDHLLWIFSQASFIPHRIATGRLEDSPPEPVIISVGEMEARGFSVLICDGALSPEAMRRYEDVLHFVVLDNEERRQESRLLWQKIRGMGGQTHHIAYAQKGKQIPELPG